MLVGWAAGRRRGQLVSHLPRSVASKEETWEEGFASNWDFIRKTTVLHFMLLGLWSGNCRGRWWALWQICCCLAVPFCPFPRSACLQNIQKLFFPSPVLILYTTPEVPELFTNTTLSLISYVWQLFFYILFSFHYLCFKITWKYWRREKMMEVIWLSIRVGEVRLKLSICY